MTLQEISDCLKTITYKPKWEFSLSLYKNGQIGIGAIAILEDVDTLHPFPLECEKVRCLKELNLNTKKDVIDLVKILIKRIENHEFQEWFKINGKRIEEPIHPNG